MTGVRSCQCCGVHIYSSKPTCETCSTGECDPQASWHCDRRADHECDGSGCDEYGEEGT